MKYNKFWKKVTRVRYRCSHIQETVRSKNSNTMHIWSVSLEPDCKDRTTELRIVSYFTNVFKHKVTSLMRTTPKINEELRRLGDAINNKLTPSFTGNKLSENEELFLLSPPTNLGPMRILVIFREMLEREFQNSSPLTEENHIFLTIWNNTKQKRFGRKASCLNQNVISRTRYESKNLAIFRSNIYIKNVLK